LETQRDRMAGKVCLITGCSSGLGKATALGLAHLGAHVVMVCRNAERGEAARADIRQQSGNETVDLLIADLASQQVIHHLASEVQKRYPQLHVLINNAGVLLSKRMLTVDGLEATLAINHLAPFLLTHLCLERLKASAPARIINVTSALHLPLNLKDLLRERRYHGFRVHRESKSGSIYFTYALAERLEGTGVTVNCAYPGAVATNITCDASFGWRLAAHLIKPFSLTPEQGAATFIWLASAPDLEGVSGRCFFRTTETKTIPETYDQALSERLWQISAVLTRLPNISEAPMR
jgi:NAD(P)-dependent dehydrogenase (short-subunit alcohol dehydrogenase family)